MTIEKKPSVTATIENDQLGVLEQMFEATSKAAAQDKDMIELCLRVYANHDKMTSAELVKACQDEWKDDVPRAQMMQAINRMVSSALTKPGYIEKTTENEEVKYGITNRGLSYLWDKFAKRNPENVLDKYGRVIALNKKLNAPDRHIESHDLYALTLLAVLRLEGKPATATDVRKVLEAWVQPTGDNAKALPSELKYTNPQTIFQRKFHNMFSSHNQISKEGLIERIDTEDESSWRVTDAGRALLMRRTLKERRNLTLQMSASALSKDLTKHVAVLNALSTYDQLAKTPEEKIAVSGFAKLVSRLLTEDSKDIQMIREALLTPATANTVRRVNNPVDTPVPTKVKMKR